MVKATPILNKLILKEIPQTNFHNGLFIPSTISAQQVVFAEVVLLPQTHIDCDKLTVGTKVALGWSPIWNKKFKYKIDGDDYLIVDEWAILGIITDESDLRVDK